MTRDRRPPPLLMVALAVVVLLFAPTPRADAVSKSPDWSQAGWRRITGGCETVGDERNPYALIKMLEYGKSGVKAFKVRFQLREYDGGISTYTAYFDTPYASSTFPNDYRSYSWYPTNGAHQFTGVLQPVRMDIKLTWDRVWYKIDWKAQRTVVLCP